MRLVAIALIAGCSGMPDVNGNPLGESGHAKLSVAPDKTSVNALGTELIVHNDGDGASGAIGARLVDHDARAFAITHSDCSVLQPGGSCAVGVVFAPGGLVSSGMTTLEIDDDNEPQTSAELDGKLEPAIKWQESSLALHSQTCTVSGAMAEIAQTAHLQYTDVAVGGVAINSTDVHYNVVNDTCIGAFGTSGTCTADVQVVRGKVAGKTAPTTIRASVMGLTANLPASYELDACDLEIEPSPLVLSAINKTATATLTNHGTVDHAIASVMFVPTQNVQLVITTCKVGTVVSPNGTCTATFTYSPSTMPQNDATSVSFGLTTSDADSLVVASSVVVAVADSQIHFDLAAYDWGDGTTDSNQDKVLHVLTAVGGAMAGPLVFSISNQAWTLDNGGGPLTCNGPFVDSCQLALRFTPVTSGEYTGTIVAKGPGGEVAFATLHGVGP